jgi:hypothetical protein
VITEQNSPFHKVRFLLASFVFFMPFLSLNAQVNVTGTVYDKESGRPLPYAFVIIQRTQNGVFCDQRGKFSMQVQPTDSLLFSLTGYQFTKVLLGDSVRKAEYNLNVSLILKPVKLRTFEVKAPKTFDQILADLDKAEKSKVHHTTSVGNAIESPITFLYMQFSREGKSIRKISELRAEDAKQALIKELFTRYMLAYIIDLDEKDMDDFIAFSGLTNSFNLFDTEYELVVYVKNRFVDYKRYRGIED